MLKFLKNWTLPIAMLVGAIGYPLFISLSFLTPYLIFTMLLLTFCKVSPRDLKPKPLHLWLLLIQIGGALAAYLLLYRFDKIVAEGVMVCIICPTATAAAVITSKLGGSAASLTTYTLIANIGAAIAVPILFPLVEVHPDVTFWEAFLVILGLAPDRIGIRFGLYVETTSGLYQQLLQLRVHSLFRCMPYRCDQTSDYRREDNDTGRHCHFLQRPLCC